MYYDRLMGQYYPTDETEIEVGEHYNEVLECWYKDDEFKEEQEAWDEYWADRIGAAGDISLEAQREAEEECLSKECIMNNALNLYENYKQQEAYYNNTFY